MQYQVTCQHCHQLYVVDAQPGETVRSRCPYCGEIATVATPLDNPQNIGPAPSVSRKESMKTMTTSSATLTRKVVVMFCVAALFIVLVAATLYVVFCKMTT